MNDNDFVDFPSSDRADPAPVVEPKKRGRPRKVSVVPPEDWQADEANIAIDPMCPPRFVRHCKTGVVTNWTPLFSSRAEQFEPFYREGTDDREAHRAAVTRRAVTDQILGGGVASAFQTFNIES